MAFTLPKVTTEIDCADIGYPGLVFTVWLNLTPEEWQPPAVREHPWETMYYHALGRIAQSLTVPAEYGDGGSVELGTAEAVYRLEQTEGFDQAILPWLVARYRKVRDARLLDETKNS